MQNVFPILVHGDDADVHRRRSYCAVTIGSPLLAGQSSWDCKFLSYIIDTSRAVTETYDTLDSWMVYGLCELQEGRFFDVDVYDNTFDRGHKGAICGKYRGVLVAMKGDQKFLQRALKLTTAWNSERCCMYCRATTFGPMLYCAFGPHAPHCNTMITNDEFLQTGCKPNSWIKLPGFHLQLVLADWLHIVDLAITPELAASDTPSQVGDVLFLLIVVEVI